MLERNMQPSKYETRKFLFCLISISIFLLIFSRFFILSFSNSSLIPKSVLMLMLLNNNSIGISSNRHPQLDSMTSPIENLDRKRPFSATRDKELKVSGKRSREACNPNEAFLKVFMYDLPTDFHFGLLGWKAKDDKVWPNVVRIHNIPEYAGGLNLQHSIEYWLTLDLLSSNTLGVVRPCGVVRVNDSNQANIIFVPFFSSVSYNRYSKIHGKNKVSKNKALQDKLVEYLMSRDEWKRWGGKDHLIVTHHPNSMLDARRRLGSAMFVLADFGRFPPEIANIRKDIVAPYMHVVQSIGDDSAPFEDRPILVYFQGAIYRKAGGFIRQELYYLLKDEKDVHFSFGSPRGSGISTAGQGMASSKFCLNIAGDTPSSNRLFDAIASHCVPVIISDDIELPFEDVLDYSEFCIFVRASDAIKPGFLLNLLRGIKPEDWIKMWNRVKEIEHHFEYQYPSQPGDAVQMIWEAVTRKLSSVRLKHHRENRFYRSELKKRN